MAETDLQQIKRETEQTRAGLTHTVEELKASVADTASDIRRRISPDAIKAEVSGYFKSRGEQLLTMSRTPPGEIQCKPSRSAPPSRIRSFALPERYPCPC